MYGFINNNQITAQQTQRMVNGALQSSDEAETRLTTANSHE